jgi:hypothetical protein
MGIVAKARSVFGVYRDPQDTDRRLFARVKLNIAAEASTLACRFTSDGPDQPLRVEWLGEDPRDARAIATELHQVSVGTEADPSRPRRALAEWLADGSWKSVQGLKDLAATDKISWKSIEKAKNDMGVRHEHLPEAGWCWRDPAAEVRKGRLRP